MMKPLYEHYLVCKVDYYSKINYNFIIEKNFLDIIQSYQSLSDENLLENTRKFQQEIMEILGQNFTIQNHPESYQHLKRLLNECKEQWQSSKNLTGSWQEMQRIRTWLQLRQVNRDKI